jgi:lipopolysaccharide/colanic/teichoic acid biosynthesis glycosyltransferase
MEDAPGVTYRDGLVDVLGGPSMVDGLIALVSEPLAAPVLVDDPVPLRSLPGKRLFDIVMSILLLIVASPLLLVTALAVKLTSRGPIFYRATRSSQQGGTFGCWKFRTMHAGADAGLAQILADDPALYEQFAASGKLTTDPRITRIGPLLRATSLDELPQLWNVIRGDMSLVGPRPLQPADWPRYGPAMAVVLGVRPGLTGLWQVSGRNKLPYDKRIALDVHYATHANWRTDLSILVGTVPVVTWRRDGV